jgi:prepilin peptidase CpaA
MSNPNLASVVLIVTAAVLLYAAFRDLRDFEIRNELILALIGLWIAYSTLVGDLTRVYWNMGFATLLLVFMLYFYARNWMGGGDVKLAAVAFLWTGVDCALLFAVLLLGFAVIHTVAAKLGWVGVRGAPGGSMRIPFAPSIAAALIGVFVLGCLQEVT